MKLIFLDETRLYDKLEVDDGWVTDSDSGDSGQQEADECEAPVMAFLGGKAERPKSSSALVRGQRREIIWCVVLFGPYFRFFSSFVHARFHSFCTILRGCECCVDIHTDV
uniref:Uncharacterized protein n=1 Tax=Eutreptiella gymnastica TaxID=73025 RepID=A0A7S1IS77_9EUGL|mmetsp:Transcript_38891/g.69609  ORF Transcript_38891/g.69609 Transcript_38891/m.69609 type:complete len:110 (+) Transcript_38891:961-1290(+)